MAQKETEKHRTERITGAQKAAILILSLPEDVAVNVIKNLRVNLRGLKGSSF